MTTDDAVTADAGRERRWSAQLRDNILVPAVVALLVALITSVGIWLWQQDRLQRWNSQVVVDIEMTYDKALSIRNAGHVGA